MAQMSVERSIWIAAPRERVWPAVTRPEHLERWYAVGCPWEIPALAVGEIVRFYNTPTEILLATIDMVDPPHQFSLRWQPEQLYPTTTLVTTFILEEENGGTRVTVTETGYESLPDDIRQARVDQTAEAYSMSIGNLKAYLEGRSIPA